MAKPFKPIGAIAITVLARVAAKKAVQEELRAQGIRHTTYPHAQIMQRAGEYLEKHPELYREALERAQRMGLISAERNS
jgi:hypothetical protein